jgi:outer membrane receptor protein involved in Fe transport
MKRILLQQYHTVSGILLIVSLTSWSSAQTVAPERAGGAADETVYELSPFEVNTSRDVGFVAASSLAGGRLAGALKDTPAAYSVLTSEFIEALDLTDLASASEWIVNQADLTGNGETEIYGGAIAELSSRGVSVGSQQRNFFPLNVNFDSYNLDRIDYSRGPNAILFGNGNFGGNANVVTKRALFGRSFGNVKMSYGTWDYRRVTADGNLALSPRLALRANLLWQDRNGWRDYDMEEKKAATLAATFKLSSRTELLLDGEVGRFTRRNPLTYLNDNLTGWDGVTVFDALVPGGSIPGATSTLYNSQGVTRFGSDSSPQYVYSPDLGYNVIRNFANTMRTLAGAQNRGTPVGGRPGQTATGSAIPNINLNNRPMNHAENAPSWMFDAAVAGSHFRPPSDRFAMSSNAPTLVQDYHTVSAFLRHRIGNFYLELAGNIAEEARDTNYLNVRGINNTYIDINRNLLDNVTPNPYFLEPYGNGQRSRSTWGNDYKNVRVAAAYALRDTKIGNFEFGVMAGANKQHQHQRIESMRVLVNADPRQWPNENAVYYRYYWNSPWRDMPEITTAVDSAGNTRPVAWMADFQRPTDVSYTDTMFHYMQAAAKGSFFSDKLHLLAAVRYDDLTVKRVVNDFRGDYPTNWDGSTIYYRPAAPDDYWSLTGMETRPRGSNNVPTVTTGRYQDDYNAPDVKLSETTYSVGAVYHATSWLSVFGNTATSYNPSTTQLRLDGSFMPSPVAKGWDAGLRFRLLKDRLNLALTYYAGSETAQTFEIPFTNNFQQIAWLNHLDDTTLENNNQEGFPVVPRQAFDQRDRENHGCELEIVANLTPHWRLMANVARAYANQTNSWTDTRAFIAKWDSTIRQVLLNGGVIFNPDTGRAQLDTTIDPNRFGGGSTSEASTAATAFNNIYFSQLPNIVDGDQLVPGLTEWTANFFTDYEFSRGPLKNLRIGAGVNWRSRRVLGFRGADTIQDPANPTDITKAVDDPSVDAYTPVYSDPYYTGTMTLSYAFKLKERYRVRLQLRIDNLFDNDEVVYHTSQPQQRPPNGDYTVTAARVSTPIFFRYTNPRSYRLTATLEF